LACGFVGRARAPDDLFNAKKASAEKKLAEYRKRD